MGSSRLSGRRYPFRLQSWIPPCFAWTTVPNVFCIEVPIDDPDVVEFISIGTYEATFHGSNELTRVVAALVGNRSLHGQLEKAGWSPSLLKPTGPRIKAGASVVAHCHGVFSLPDGKTLCVVVGREMPVTPQTWISASVKADADALLLEHRAKAAEFDEYMKREEQNIDDFYARNSDMNASRGSSEALLAIKSFDQRPILTAERLLPALPRAAKLMQSGSGDLERIARSALAAIAASNWPSSRDGTYSGILLGAAGRRVQALVSWVPHSGLPSYSEVRWAVQKRLPAALRKPRIGRIGNPKFDTVPQPAEESVQIQGVDPDSTALRDVLDDLQLDDRDFRNRVDDIRRNTEGRGFEAIAWFQPYHVWTEETWGIYIDARKLDDFALSFLEDFKSQLIHGSHGLAALLAFGLIYAHELFHARVEAVLSWQELNAQQPRHLRYQDRVYQALRETPEWLEEALANWSAWSWFEAPGVQAMVAHMSSNAKELERVVENSLDLSPPGYREWRLGNEPGTWRKFANQLSTGNPKIAVPGKGLPLEGTLTGPLPYDFRTLDIPLRFVGPGVIADRLQSHPATFHVPPRRELERALKHLQHSLDATGGKGGHQKWTGPDQRAFILPTRDPVSVGVFKTFLHHVGIDKATYVRQVRPRL